VGADRHNEALFGQIKEAGAHVLGVVRRHRRLKPGYGWIFPCPGGVYNIGVGLIDSHRARADGRAAALQRNLREVFDTLSPMEADILRKRMGLGDQQEMTLKEIGARYSLSRERIRQVQEQALAKLRGEFKRRALL
jgi:RNA polymerase sigma factor (sigma-70 family)